MAYIVIAPKERRKNRPEKGRTMKLRNRRRPRILQV
uniref:Uncharacterized protein n=1 Tax=Podoviridae sp. ct9H612 TaxID=2825226 RepID=A0A8S5VIL2_9CAUD|nr:MAG TPA: hypothetical protein [Podoviridae sp. ct9H612]